MDAFHRKHSLQLLKNSYRKEKIAEYGIKSAKIEFDFASVMKRVAGVVKKIEPNDSVERYTEIRCRLFSGEAKIISPYHVPN